MGFPRRFLGFQVGLALLMGALSPQPLLGGQTRQVTTLWIVKYVSGSEPIILTPRRKHFIVRLRRGDKIKVQLSNNEIVFHRRKKLLLSISDAEVIQITYDHKSHRLSRKVIAGLNDSGAADNCGLGCAAVAMAYVGGILATLPFKYTDYFVQILWQENGIIHAIEVQLGKRNYPAFLDVLQNATHKPAKPWPSKRLAHTEHEQHQASAP